MIALPENWSDWNVIGEIGRGSFSVVYEAERKDDPSVRCAIKVITVPQDDSEYDDLIADGFNTQLSRSFFAEAVKDFTREIRLMEHFKGMQNIVSIEDYKVIPKEDGIGSHIFIRMELLTSLEKYINDKTLTEDEIIQIGVDICTALEFCQDKQIIHRDIKPANIFVNDRLGTHVFYKLGDFGIARNLEGKTQDLSSKGTPNYMAPEVAANMKYNSTADIYSLGLTLYWLMNANRLPFFPQTQLYTPSAKREALQRRLSGEQIEPPVNASPELSDIILKACSYHPVDRYQQASEMKKALLKLQSAREQKALAGSSGDNTERSRSRQVTKRKNRLVGILSVAVLLAAVAFGFHALQSHKPEATEEAGSLTTEALTQSVGIVATDVPKQDTTENPTEAPASTPESVAEATAVPQQSEVSLIPVPTPDLSEFTEVPESSYLFETLSDGTARITRYLGSTDINKLLLPEDLDGHMVSALGSSIFPENDIREIAIPDCVSEIDEYAFENCNKVVRIWLPRSLKQIERNPFQPMDKLQEIYLSNENLYYQMFDGILYDKGMERLIACPPGWAGNVCKVPDTVKSIESEAFHNVEALRMIIFPEDLETIGENAFFSTGLLMVDIPQKCTEVSGYTFYLCRDLKEVNLPDGIRLIGDDAFAGCSSLESIQIPDSVISIGNGAFYDCARLKSFVIPKSVRNIAGNPFSSCGELQDLVVEEGNTRFYVQDGILFDKTEQRLVSYPSWKSWSSYVIPDGIRIIGSGAFSSNYYLKEIIFNENVHYIIEDHAFALCTGLVKVYLPDNVIEIGESAFLNCMKLSYVRLPASLHELNRMLFYGCWDLTEVVMPEELTSISYSVFSRCTKLKSIEIPSSVKSISHFAFDDCENLTLIVTSGSYAEQFCIESGMNYQLLENEETSVLPPTQEQTSSTEEPAEEPTEEPFPEWLLED